MRQSTSITGCVRWLVCRSVTHSFDDPNVAPIGLLGLVILFFFFNFFVCFTTLYATFRGLILRPFNTFLFVCPYVCLSVRLSVSPTYSESYAQCWIFFCSLFTKPLILSDSFTHDRPPQICLTWTQTLTIATCSTSYVKDYRSPSYQHQQTATIRIKVRRRN